MAVLTIFEDEEGPGRPTREIELGVGETLVGRGEQAQLILNNPTVSRGHASFTATTQGFQLQDLESANGTWVNGKKIDRVLLRDGDEIKLGRVRIVFGDPPDPQATVLVDMNEVEIEPKPEPEIKTDSEDPDGPTHARAPMRLVIREKPNPVTPPPVVVPKEQPVVEDLLPAAELEPPGKPESSLNPEEVPDLGEQPLVPEPVVPPVRPAPPPPARAKVPATAPPPAAARRTPAEVPRHAAREVMTPSRMIYAGFWIRTAAYLVDMAILMVALGIVIVGMTALASFLRQSYPIVDVVLLPVYVLFSVVIPVTYILVSWVRVGATPGKRLLGLEIVAVNGGKLGFGSALARLAGYFLSSIVLYLGFLMVAFADKKRGLHDMVAGTVVIRR